MRLFQLLSLGFCSAALASNWPQFRGPNGDGHADEAKVPSTWSETQNVKWKTPIHGRAWSSPVVWGNQIWLTTASENAKELFAICVDAESGKILRDAKLFDVERPQFHHAFNSAGSPTPVIEEGRVYITFGSPGTVCLDAQTGKVLWERRDIECNHYRGAGSSPILYRDLLIMNFDGSDAQFIIALDKKSGKTVWRKSRSIDFKDLGPDGKPKAEGDFRKAFATPHVAEIEGKPLLISQGANAAYGYDPLAGEEFWRVEERTSHSGGTRPLVGHGLIFFPSGWSQGQLLAVKPGGRGDVTGTHVAWRVMKAAAKKPSLLLVDDLLFMNNDGGIVTAIEAKTGQEVWSERIGGNYSASPIFANGHAYFFSEEGKTTVLAPGREFKKVAENKLDGGFMASPAVTGNALILRTKTHLYRVE
ncbi:MAG TPA: PQQ-binding-like beta-propeller repeat protein [Methylomirabilota bacterium]|nr:PQQ-binding-like beta-propeller repeat protein [Methylomirabilota bacterium]